MFNDCCEKLAKQQITVAIFESASAGYLSYKFSLSPMSGDILIGSLVCYDLSVKENTLGIPSTFIETYTAESMEVTKALIEYGKKMFKADLYIACTGLLKRGGSETLTKPVGTFFYVILFKKKIYKFRCHFTGTPKQKLESLIKEITKSIIKII